MSTRTQRKARAQARHQTSPAVASPVLEAELPLRPFSSIPPLPTVMLSVSPVVLPRGHVVLIAGEGGIGKGTMIASLAADVTQDRLAAGVAGTVITVNPEDPVQEVTAWRLKAAEADLARVFDMTVMPGGSGFYLDGSGRTTGSVPVLRAKIEEFNELAERTGDPSYRVLMVTIDPLRKCVRGGSIQNDDGAARVMVPLMKLAEETGVCIVVSHHVTWDGKIGGSRGLVNSARLVYRAERDRYDARIVVLRVEKTNLLDSYTVQPARYTILGKGKDAHVVWGEAVTPTEDVAKVASWRERALQTASPGAVQAADGPAAIGPPALRTPAELAAARLCELQGGTSYWSLPPSQQAPLRAMAAGVLASYEQAGGSDGEDDLEAECPS